MTALDSGAEAGKHTAPENVIAANPDMFDERTELPRGRKRGGRGATHAGVGENTGLQPVAIDGVEQGQIGGKGRRGARNVNEITAASAANEPIDGSAAKKGKATVIDNLKQFVSGLPGADLNNVRDRLQQDVKYTIKAGKEPGVPAAMDVPRGVPIDKRLASALVEAKVSGRDVQVSDGNNRLYVTKDTDVVKKAEEIRAIESRRGNHKFHVEENAAGRRLVFTDNSPTKPSVRQAVSEAKLSKTPIALTLGKYDLGTVDSRTSIETVLKNYEAKKREAKAEPAKSAMAIGTDVKGEQAKTADKGERPLKSRNAEADVMKSSGNVNEKSKPVVATKGGGVRAGLEALSPAAEDVAKVAMEKLNAGVHRLPVSEKGPDKTVVEPLERSKSLVVLPEGGKSVLPVVKAESPAFSQLDGYRFAPSQWPDLGSGRTAFLDKTGQGAGLLDKGSLTPGAFLDKSGITPHNRDVTSVQRRIFDRTSLPPRLILDATNPIILKPEAAVTSPPSVLETPAPKVVAEVQPALEAPAPKVVAEAQPALEAPAPKVVAEARPALETPAANVMEAAKPVRDISLAADNSVEKFSSGSGFSLERIRSASAETTLWAKPEYKIKDAAGREVGVFKGTLGLGSDNRIHAFPSRGMLGAELEQFRQIAQEMGLKPTSEKSAVPSFVESEAQREPEIIDNARAALHPEASRATQFFYPDAEASIASQTEVAVSKTRPLPAAPLAVAHETQVESAPASKTEVAPVAKVEPVPAAKMEVTPVATVEPAPEIKTDVAHAAAIEAKPVEGIFSAPEFTEKTGAGSLAFSPELVETHSAAVHDFKVPREIVEANHVGAKGAVKVPDGVRGRGGAVAAAALAATELVLEAAEAQAGSK